MYDFVGIDVSKDRLDTVLLTDSKPIYKAFDNNPAGFKKLHAWLKKYTQNPWVCMEATGHYSELIAEFLVKQRTRVSIVNPKQIKLFAKMKLARNKNDILDARIIAQYCQSARPRVFQPRSARQKEIRELVQVIDTLKEQVVQLKNQRNSIQIKSVKQEYNSILLRLEKKIDKLIKKLSDSVKQDKEYDKMASLLVTIKGVGELTAHRVIAYLPDLSLFENAKQFAAFFGLSPCQRQSGQYAGQTKMSKIGHACLRKALYLPAISMKNHNPYLQPFVKRLQASGHPPKSIIGAVMRKLAHIIYGMLKKMEAFNPGLV